MATASNYTSFVSKHPPTFQWFWNSASDSWSGDEQWQNYTDIENEIIEDAYSAKKTEVEIDGDYVISFEHQIQYKKSATDKQRPVKRVQFNRDRSNDHLREERFWLPIILAPTSQPPGHQPETRDPLDRLLKSAQFRNAYHELELKNTPKTIANVVESAAAGIITEGTTLGKTSEAEWLAQRLLSVKHFGTHVVANLFSRIAPEIGKTCIYLYTKESFWYKLINRVLRAPETIKRDQVLTLGPFCWLLYEYLIHNYTTDVLVVYRGLTVTDEQRQQVMKPTLQFPSFTSTSRNREKAEQFGNTLLIIDLNVKYRVAKKYYDNVKCGANISHLSDFPNEEEFLIWPGRYFHFVKEEYDNVKKKHVIYLKSSEENH
ncbi:unnamed protein product [Didymodactylos carnosus]|uniref:NAD(P)(+)--arginine ADP-ribosyltransferase n=1 Tax=Didymodactylos carnosus TaxID=1234261 RepID=A0A814PET7_9BILA|nr:unnamed protein product [Didymodactylos carnosus]CAF3871502.1 unnamed protein product [Didymodactylos carnosus]